MMWSRTSTANTDPLKRSELADRVCCSWHSKYREAAMAGPEMSPPERLVHLSGHHLAAITRRRADGCASNVAFAKSDLAHLARNQTQPAAVERCAEWYSN